MRKRSRGRSSGSRSILGLKRRDNCLMRFQPNICSHIYALIRFRSRLLPEDPELGRETKWIERRKEGMAIVIDKERVRKERNQ